MNKLNPAVSKACSEITQNLLSINEPSKNQVKEEIRKICAKYALERIPRNYEILSMVKEGDFDKRKLTDFVNFGNVTAVDDDGNYTISGLLEGTYRLWTDTGLFYGTVDEYYDNLNASDAANATIIDVKAGEDVLSIDFELKNGGSISGRVVDAAGRRF